MNRGNIWIHVGIAVVLVVMAAVVGQIDRWRTILKSPAVNVTRTIPKPVTAVRNQSREPEVLVKFRQGVTLAEIKRIAGLNHDQVDDEIESVKGLTFIDDLDNVDAATVAEQYRRM